MAAPDGFTLVRPEELSGRDRYDLLTSLVVPRPIGWISTRSAGGVNNLAPFSYFAALSASPLLVGVSIGIRKDGPKDTLANMRTTGSFCVNVCSEELLEAMNTSSGEYPAEVDEFMEAGLSPVEGTSVPVPWVGEAPAALECEVVEEVRLRSAPNALIVGEVRCIHLAPSLERFPESWAVDPVSLKPVGRLGRDRYQLPREIRLLARPR